MLDELKTTNKVIGLKQTAKAVKSDLAKKVYIADDADTFVVSGVIAECEKRNVDICHVATMSHLGAMCNIDVGASVVAVLK